MPRVTRAALRWQETQEESNVAASVPLPLTPATNRVVLGETTGNIASGKQLAIDNEDVGATKKAPKESTRGNAAKKATKFKKAKGEEQKVEVLEDDDQSTSSAAAEEASNDLLNEGSSRLCLTHRSHRFVNMIDSSKPRRSLSTRWSTPNAAFRRCE